MAGEVVFNTGMVGYPETLTDPSYTGQILVLTYPLIGNYGMPAFHSSGGLHPNYESPAGTIRGLIVADYSNNYQHWNEETSLSHWLYKQRIPALSGIDTRRLTRHLRDKGSMLGKIILDGKEPEWYDPNKEHLVRQISRPEIQTFGDGKRVLFLDCGTKENIIRELTIRNLQVIRVPFDYDISQMEYDGLLVSNGPGDPAMCTETIQRVQLAYQNERPVMGICLGHQIMALAAGASTYKMKFGHRGQNQPVLNHLSQQAFVSSQNHGYAVDIDHLPKDWKTLYTNLNDQTIEGIIHESGRFFSVQFHPEAAPGPVDTSFIFNDFAKLLEGQ